VSAHAQLLGDHDLRPATVASRDTDAVNHGAVVRIKGVKQAGDMAWPRPRNSGSFESHHRPHHQQLNASPRRWPDRSRPVDRAGVSHPSLTIASNSASSHSSSSQTNAQKATSTAPEPSAEPVFSRPSIYDSPLDGHPNVLMYVRWYRFGISPDAIGGQEGRGN